MKQISIICKMANPVTAITELLSEAVLDIRDLNFKQLGSDGVLSLIADSTVNLTLRVEEKQARSGI